MAAVVAAVSMVVAGVEVSTGAAATAEAAVTTARLAVVATAVAIAGATVEAIAAAITAATTIRCRRIVPTRRDAPAIPTIPLRVAATTPRIAAIRTQRVTE